VPRIAACAALALVAAATPAVAQHVELSAGLGVAASGFDTTYTHAFVPRVAFDPTSGGSAGHTLALDGSSGASFAATLDLGLGGRAGVQALVVTGAHDLAGPSSPYAIRLAYTAPQPPSNLPQRFTLEREEPWPDGAGRLRHLAIGVAARVRAVDRPAWTLDLLAGPTVHRVSGSLDGLGFSDFRLGGHGVLFSDTFRLGTDLEPRWRPGFTLGASAGVVVSGRVRLVVDARWLRAARTDLQPAIARILNPDEIINALTPSEIAQRLTPAPLELRPSFTAVTAGLRVAF
jgi:hypothetical protein